MRGDQTRTTADDATGMWEHHSLLKFKSGHTSQRSTHLLRSGTQPTTQGPSAQSEDDEAMELPLVPTGLGKGTTQEESVHTEKMDTPS